MDLIFTIRTHHGDYLHEVDVSIPDSASDIKAWETIQQASPYTPTVYYDDRNKTIRKCVEYVGMARRKPTVNPYEHDGRDGFFPGFSWTWIRVNLSQSLIIN
jgi:hypothetical protein